MELKNKDISIGNNYEISSNPIKNNVKDKKRMYNFDNLRGLGIILVVLVHMTIPFLGLPWYSEVRKISTIIAMPLIFFVSGYFSKIDENTKIKSFKSLIIPYILFETLWVLFKVSILDSGFYYPYLIPSKGLWYLISLFWMRLALPPLVKIKHIFIFSIIGTLLIGLVCFPENLLAITKTIYYIPIFLLGYYFKNSDMLNPKIKNIGNKIKILIIKYKFLILSLVNISLATLSLFLGG